MYQYSQSCVGTPEQYNCIYYVSQHSRATDSPTASVVLNGSFPLSLSLSLCPPGGTGGQLGQFGVPALCFCSAGAALHAVLHALSTETCAVVQSRSLDTRRVASFSRCFSCAAQMRCWLWMAAIYKCVGARCAGRRGSWAAIWCLGRVWVGDSLAGLWVCYITSMRCGLVMLL